MHPAIARPNEHARIADVGTGTAIFLRELVPQLPATTDLCGFDISSAQFPPSSTLPKNISLHLANVKVGFPSAFHGTFDVVVVRLLVAALSEQEWPTVTQNLMKLLKPGGWLQWQEPDGLQGKTVLRDEVGASRSNLQASLDEVFAEKAIRDKFDYPSRNLDRIFKKAGLDHVVHDVVSTDRQPHLRCTTTLISIQGLVSGMRGGMNGRKYSKEDVDSQVKGWMEDVESGAYQRYNIHCFVGRKSYV